MSRHLMCHLKEEEETDTRLKKYKNLENEIQSNMIFFLPKITCNAHFVPPMVTENTSARRNGKGRKFTSSQLVKRSIFMKTYFD